MNNPKPGWNAADAVSLVDQGYTVERASTVSGYSVAFLQAQLKLREEQHRTKQVQRKRAHNTVPFPVRRAISPQSAREDRMTTLLRQHA